ncbi:MAG TPA: tetratricopeptide repeat-containing diguanylate cyclase [Gemmatimonadaceae bacterium]|nr:tetratricopeptide repeat-containing diguanylate cyclase [Gemmatimonadaceae bacterium]
MMLRRRGGCRFRVLLVAACALSLAGRTSVAQNPTADLENRLPTLTGLERARALAKLVDAHKLDEPERALRYGAEAIRLFAVTPDPAPNISALNEMGWASMTLGRYDSATFYADSARHFAERVGDKAGEARALSNLGSLAQRMGDPTKAVGLFNQALVLQRAAGNDRELANSLNNLGFVYSTDLADYPRSLSLHLEALSIRQRLGDKAAIALSLNNIGIVYDRLHQFDQALAYFDRALALRRELGAKARIAATLSNIGDTYFDAKDYANALVYQRQALEIRAALDDRSAIALSHLNIGLLYIAMNQLDAARRELRTAMVISDQVQDKGLAAQIHLGMAKAERAGGAPATAKEHASEALALANAMPSRELIRRSTEELAADDEAQGQLASALAEFKRAKVVSDSIFSANTSRRIATLEQMYSDAQRGREIDSLRRERAELEVRASHRALQRDGAAVLALLIAIVAFGAYRRRVERTRMAEALSVTDALTGIWNRRYVQQTMHMDVAASLRRYRATASRGETPDDADLIFLMLDVDHFKRVNDDYGHAAGDLVLTQLATVLRKACRDSDAVVRWGGEEFLIISRFTNREQASRTAERLRLAVERHATTLPDGRTVRVTCSIGFAPYPFDLAALDALGWEAVVQLADHAAYAAKREGRNSWVGFLRNASVGAPLASAPASHDEMVRLIDAGRIRQLTSWSMPAGVGRLPITTPEGVERIV